MADEKEKITNEYIECVFNYNYTTSLIPANAFGPLPFQKQPDMAIPPELLSFIKARIDIKLSDTIITDILNAEDEFYGRQP